jgi:hypothetical protein
MIGGMVLLDDGAAGGQSGEPCVVLRASFVRGCHHAHLNRPRGVQVFVVVREPVVCGSRTAGSGGVAPSNQETAMSKQPVTEAKPDRPPTEAEEQAAERAAKDVDVAKVGENYEEMLEVGADVQGEGQIEPDQ